MSFAYCTGRTGAASLRPTASNQSASRPTVRHLWPGFRTYSNRVERP